MLLVWLALGCVTGWVIWFAFIAPIHARKWHRQRIKYGLPPKDPPGLVGTRERMTRKS